ncbi:MAG: helix-turn-helix domain-containing protein [Actinomycetota bacterium]|nr:helix-turn-helix domain-containing protein [Actinomycetota bacterium]
MQPAAPTQPAARFLTLADVAEILNISGSQTYALVRNRDLEAIKIGGRGQWRVEHSKLEEYIARMYDQTRRFVDEHPFLEATESVVAAPPVPTVPHAQRPAT